MTTNQESILPSSEELEVQELPEIRCPVCSMLREQGSSAPHPLLTIDCHRTHSTRGRILLEGIVTCEAEEHPDGSHSMPIRIRDNVIESTDPGMPISESRNLDSQVPDGIVQDVEEAERAHFTRCYKASVIMCRRAMQLGLIDKDIPDGPWAT